jgi:hypothetical protein
MQCCRSYYATSELPLLYRYGVCIDLESAISGVTLTNNLDYKKEPMKEKAAAEQGSEITTTTAHQQTKHMASLIRVGQTPKGCATHTAKIINLLYWYGIGQR